MQIRNTKERYGWVSITLHWLMALAIFGMFGLGLYMVNLSYMDTWYKQAPRLHVSVGMVLLMLWLVRWLWRLGNTLPQVYGSRLEQGVGLLVHRLHYALMLALMVSGYLIVTAHGRGAEVFDWFEVPALLPAEKGREAVAGQAHRYLAWMLMGLVVLHVAAAIKHHVLDKDKTLLRMLGVNNTSKGEE